MASGLLLLVFVLSKLFLRLFCRRTLLVFVFVSVVVVFVFVRH